MAESYGAERPSFLPVVRDASGGLILSLQGEGNTNYVIEASTDLESWTAVFTGVSSAAGKLDYAITAAAGPRASYYLARFQTAIETLRLLPQADSQISAVALLTTNGAALALTNSAGVVYSFTVPPMAVLETVGISMTLVTNINGFPLTNGFGTALSFAPEGLEFYAPCVLKIRYPTNISMLDVVSYTFAGDGTDMSLLPDRVSSNSVMIPVLHFSGVGSSSGGNQAASIFARKSVENACRRLSHQMGEAVLEARQSGNPNATSQTLSQFNDLADKYYDEELKGREEQATRDCLLAKELAQCALAMGRAVQLLGGTPAFTDRYLGSVPCEELENCIKEAKVICAVNPALAMQMFLEVKRRAALLGSKCSLPSEHEFQRECQPEWSGSISFTEVGGTNKTTTLSGGGKSVSDTTVAYSATTYITGGTANTAALNLQLEGPADGYVHRHSVGTEPAPCDQVRTQISDGVYTGTGTQKINLGVQFFGTNAFMIMVGTGSGIRLENGFGYSSDVIPPCTEDGKGGRSFYHSGPSVADYAPTFLILLDPLPFGNTDEIVGTVTTNVISSGIPVTATWKFDVRRKK